MRFAVLAVLLFGCAHYRPMIPQYYSGQRHPQKVAFSSCTNYFLSFTEQEKNSTFAEALDKFNLTPDKIFSIDEKYWVWLWPFYYWRCIELNVNDKFVATKEPQDSSQASTLQNRASVEVSSKETPKKDSEPGTITGDIDHDLAQCNKLSSNLKIKNCQKLIKRQYDGLEKAN